MSSVTSSLFLFVSLTVHNILQYSLPLSCLIDVSNTGCDKFPRMTGTDAVQHHQLHHHNHHQYHHQCDFRGLLLYAFLFVIVCYDDHHLFSLLHELLPSLHTVIWQFDAFRPILSSWYSFLPPTLPSPSLAKKEETDNVILSPLSRKKGKSFETVFSI